MFTKFALTQDELIRHNRQVRSEAIVDFMNEHTEKYNAIVKFTKDNFNKLVNNAVGLSGVSVADQVQMYTDCPYPIAEEVVRSVAHLQHI